MKNLKFLFIIFSLALLQSACGKKEEVVEAPKVCTNTCKSWEVRTDYPDCQCTLPEYKLPDAQLQAKLVQAALNGDLAFLMNQFDKEHINPDAYLGLSEMENLIAFRETLSRNKPLYNSIKKTTNDLTLAAIAASDRNNGQAVLKILAERQADFNKPALNGRKPLEIALDANNVRTIPILLKNGAKGDIFSGKENYLEKAITDGNMDLANSLMDYAISENVDLKSILPTLENAIDGRSQDLITILLDKAKVDPNQFDEDGNPIIVKAAMKGKTNYLNMMLLAGADINLMNSRGQTPLMALIELSGKDVGNMLEMVTFLIVNGADLTAVDSNGESAIFYAVRSGNEKLIKTLVEQGADINARNSQGDSPLFTVVAEDNQKMVKFLLENGASARLTNRNKTDAATLAAQMGFMDTYDIIESYK